MNEGWVRYDGSGTTKPPKGKRIVVCFRDKTITQGLVEHWDWAITGDDGDIIAWGYAYVEPEPEMPEVVWIRSHDGLLSFAADHDPSATRYRRCVEKVFRHGATGHWSCKCGAWWDSVYGAFCPACGAEVKR